METDRTEVSREAGADWASGAPLAALLGFIGAGERPNPDAASAAPGLRGRIVELRWLRDGTVTLVLEPGAPPDVAAPRPPAGPIVAAAAVGLTHDPRGAVFYLGGRALRLAALEYRLLRYFVEHPGQLLSADQILDAVWGPTWTGNRGVLYARIGRLREELGPEAGGLIRAQRGAGYRFTPAPAG